MGSLISPYSVTGSVVVGAGGTAGSHALHMHHLVRLSGIQAASGSSAVFIHLQPNERDPLQTWDN